MYTVLTILLIVFTETITDPTVK